MHRFLLFSFVLSFVSIGAIAQNVEDGELLQYVILAEGDTLRGDVSLHERLLRSDEVEVDGERYSLSDLKEVQTADAQYVVASEALAGTLLLRRVSTGRISLYSETLFGGPSMMVGPNGQFMMGAPTSSSIEYFRIGEGDAQKATDANLRAAMADNAEATQILQRRQTLKYAQLGIAAAGIATAIFGYTQSSEESPSPIMFVGAGVALGSWIPSIIRGPLLQDAIDAYNK